MARDSASRANNPPPDAESSAPAPNGSAAVDRAGRDERRRGWFWHWNGIVTQYIPLIGLKGVGLLNSYTVWTDRREDSPHRGYAFPSQQSEANFYGEDRSELITINKILVALDLIEIRKEMVRKTDEQGRRWKVPQNLYRVKDRQDGLDLTTADVIRVIELADRDKAVYRYIRKIFSAKFEPIDRNNVWHEILGEIDNNSTWKKLAGQAAKQEARASARTKAGHRSRARRQEQMPDDDAPVTASKDSPHAPQDSMPGATGVQMTIGHIRSAAFGESEQQSRSDEQQETIAELPNSGSNPAVATSNNGSKAADDQSSNGSNGSERGSVANTNHGHESSVEPGNTMYYQSPSTTTTTTTSPPGYAEEAQPLDESSEVHESDHDPDKEQDQERVDGNPADHNRRAPSQTGRSVPARDGTPGGEPPERNLAGAAGGGPMGDPSPLVLSLYEAANDRTATRLERILLSELEVDATAPAQAAGSSGADWVAAALREAVGSGSAFVAPKRIREILNRWAASGAGPRGDASGQHRRDVASDHAIRQVDDPSPELKRVLDGPLDENSESGALVVTSGDAAQGERLWHVVLDILAAEGVGRDLFRLRGVVPIGERDDGEFVLGAPTRLAARLLTGRYRQPVERALSSLLSVPIQITVLNRDNWTVSD